MPVCNGYSKKWQDYIYGEGGVIDKWMALGIDGLRLDVADELTDEFIEGIRRAIKRNKKDAFLIGEVWDDPTTKGRKYLSSGKGMDSVMNYQLTDGLIRYFKYEDVDSIRNVLNRILTNYPPGTVRTLMNSTSTHDISRPINIFALDEFKRYGGWSWDPINDDREYQKNRVLTKEEYERGKEIYKAYSYTLATMPGIFSIFYGDEAGIQGMGNLANRKSYPWGREDKDLVNYFRFLGSLRNNEKFLEKADMNIVDINNKYMTFERQNGEDKALVTINRSYDTVKTPIPEEYQDSEEKYSLNESDKEEIKPHGALVLKKKLR
jgi:glycosidase